MTVRVEVMEEDPDPEAENYKTVAEYEIDQFACPICKRDDIQWIIMTPEAVTYAHISNGGCNTKYSPSETD
jgi:hypothetical protein